MSQEKEGEEGRKGSAHFVFSDVGVPEGRGKMDDGWRGKSKRGGRAEGEREG